MELNAPEHLPNKQHEIVGEGGGGTEEHFLQCKFQPKVNMYNVRVIFCVIDLHYEL